MDQRRATEKQVAASDYEARRTAASSSEAAVSSSGQILFSLFANGRDASDHAWYTGTRTARKRRRRHHEAGLLPRHWKRRGAPPSALEASPTPSGPPEAFRGLPGAVGSLRDDLHVINKMSGTSACSILYSVWFGPGLEASISNTSKNDLRLDDIKIVVQSRDNDKINLRVDLTGEETQKAFDAVLTNLAGTAPPVPGFRRKKGGLFTQTRSYWH
ncbi:hypothetical protein ZIOFF_047598 [Zingiber officinale]|uniref:Uncharacterized protein n=1 Tax=Zingiber officinale TaxID=94328 RepID=A0A8J5KVV9_ZINOF|nr:hypothetical protein ZIOFF_047598 [Zingiber officinale]